MNIKSVMLASAIAATAGLGLPASAQAEVVGLVPADTSFVTEDGVEVSLHLEGNWNKMDTANLTGTSREGRGDFKVSATVNGNGASVKGSQVQLGVLFGCFANLGSVSVGAQLNIGPQASIEAGFPVPIVPKGSFNAYFTPSISASITPGAINASALSQKSLDGSEATIHVRDVHLNIDGCLGPATIQVYATVAANTSAATESSTVYSQRIFI